MIYRSAADQQMLKLDHDIQDIQEESMIRIPEMDKEFDDGNLELTDEDIMSIHHAIHDPSKPEVITIQGQEFTISEGKAGCRFVRILQVTYIEQNREKESKYAHMAKQGKKITWIVRRGAWGLVMDNVFIRRGASGEFAKDETEGVIIE